MLTTLLAFQLVNESTALWSLISFVVGGCVAYLLVRPRLKRTETALRAESERAQELDAERQRLQVQNAGLQAASERVENLIAQSESDRLTILDLTQKHSTVAATLEARDGMLSESASRLADITDELSSVRNQLATAETAHAGLLSTLEAREAALKDERAQIEQMQRTLRDHFASLSAAALRGNSEAFLESAKRVLALQHQTAESELDKRKEAIANLVQPIEEGIRAVSEAARNMETARVEAFGSISEQLRQSVVSASEIAKQAAALKDALKRPNVRGRWGEVQLKICIELAGMEEHCDVEFQETSLTNDDELLRPDMIVRMPGGRKITVDAKTPMDHFLSYIDASTDEERHTALRNHGKTVKGHVSNLAKTAYMQRIAESPDFVVMFLPNESFLAMALEKEPGLMEDALKKKVLIATPGTLIGLLKVIRYGWTDEKTARNVHLIKEEGAKLNGHIMDFLEDFSRLSLALENVNEAFGNSKRKVENGIAKSSLKLSELGVTKAALPKVKKVSARVTSILKAAGADDEEIQAFESQENLALAATAQDTEEEDED